jgi:hypothetical protein
MHSNKAMVNVVMNTTYEDSCKIWLLKLKSALFGNSPCVIGNTSITNKVKSPPRRIKNKLIHFFSVEVKNEHEMLITIRCFKPNVRPYHSSILSLSNF